MDKGVEFVLLNFEKTIKLVRENKKYEHLKRKVETEYNRVKYIKYTGNMYEYFSKFKGGTHKYAEEFAFLGDYGIISNELMADYLKDNYENEMDHYCGIDDLIVGNIYTNNEIANIFRCSNMGGMRRSREKNALVLIAKHNNPLYDDQWTDEGILNYTGMGTIGDQDVDFAQNKTLLNSKSEGINVYLFESYKDNEYYYIGQVEIAGDIFFSEEMDSNGNLRKVVKFPLKKVSDNHIVINLDSVKQSENEKIKEVRKKSLDDIKAKAKKIRNNTVNSKEVKTIYKERNQYVSEYTKNRANGMCDLCKQAAPFKDKNGNDYLESHHVITLADGGPDGIFNTVALCPNCHRKVHILNNKDDIEKLKQAIYDYLKADDDIENLKKYKELFKEKVKR